MAPDKKEAFTKGVKNDPEKKGGGEITAAQGSRHKSHYYDFRGCQTSM